MIANDTNGLYTLEIKPGSNIVKEILKGSWTEDDLKRMHNVYVTKIYPLLRGKKWAKLTDITEYKTSSIGDAINRHIKWSSGNGLTKAAIIVTNSINKMQMKRGDGGLVNPKMFSTESEAIAWLNSEGFR